MEGRYILNVAVLDLPTNRYEVVRGVVPADVLDHVRGFLEREVESTVAPILAEMGLEDSDALRDRIANGDVTETDYAGLSDEARKAVTGHFRLEARLSPVLHDIPRSAPVLDLLRKVLRSEQVHMHLPPVARYVFPGNRLAGVPAHRDAAYNAHMTDFVTMWVPLVPIDGECGGVRFFPDLDPLSLESVEQDPDRPWLSPIDTGSLDGIHHPMSPGDVVLFDKNVVHQSAANSSTRTRLSIDFRFFGGEDSSTKPHLDLATGEAVHPVRP